MKEILQYRLTKTIPWFLTAVASYQEAQAVGVVVSYPIFVMWHNKDTLNHLVRIF